ncbi:unnamed protein product [Arctogadus glacialis]
MAEAPGNPEPHQYTNHRKIKENYPPKSAVPEKKVDELKSDDAWLLDLGFLKELTAKLKVFHIELRITDRHLPRTISTGNAYKAKLGVWTTHLKNGRLTRFTGWRKCHSPLEDKNAFTLSAPSTVLTWTKWRQSSNSVLVS